jgi:hypothetical protein
MSDDLINGTTQILPGSITDASVSTAAAIAMSKIANYVKLILSDGSVSMAANLNLASYLINNVANGVAAGDAVNLGQVEALISAAVSGWTFEGAWSVGTAYSINQFVTFANAVYLCVALTTGNEPDTDGGVHWELLLAAPAGSSGAAGVRGSLIYVQAGAPGTIVGAIADDIYINNANGYLYQFDGTNWNYQFTLTGGGGATYTGTLPIVVTGSVISINSATSGSQGIVRPDDTTIYSSGGILTVATATSASLGVVEAGAAGTGLSISTGGALSITPTGVNGGSADAIAYSSPSSISVQADGRINLITAGGGAASLEVVTSASFTLSLTLTPPLVVYTGTVAAAWSLPYITSANQGLKFKIKNLSGYSMTISANSPQTIDGASSYTLTAQYQFVEVTAITVGTVSQWIVTALG